ncbi:hypothetical protein [Nocardioides flavescens]|uniref:Lipoprotein n=1 Tax=Nocardioides flavescens TaxID=2691959 RepID=A0A6L7EQ51_9ACTN|nr:hypothetical protein [Nocardioides flavescens]MXG89433.1 hypothetical protein [Nocardioides flavescens]
MRRAGAAACVAALLLTGACTDDPSTDETGGAAPGGASPSASIYTLTPLPAPSQAPPSGTLVADLRQSSRDAAAGRFEVWIDNDTDDAITPTRISYADGRFRAPLPATRLREIPSQSTRGFQIAQPDRPACRGREAAAVTAARVTVAYRTAEGERRRVTVPVSDEAEVAERYASSRCLELGVDRVATLSWADEVPSSGEVGSTSTLTLRVDPTGLPGHTLSIDSIRGTPILNSADGDWEPAVTVDTDTAAFALPLPVKPTRCDAHAFAESGGATAFVVNLHLDGEPGQVTVRMDPAGAAAAIAFARASCGDLT